MEIVKDTLCISCGIFKKEIEFLIKEKRITFPFVFLDSTLHMNPEKLQEVLGELIKEALNNYLYIILIYGDCHPYMDDFYDSKRVFRIKGINCCENILGREEYRRLRKEGVFFVFEEWAHRWKEIFVDAIGLNKKIAPLFMGSMHKSILYIDTGVSVIPVEVLEEMSAYFVLPYNILKINLDFLAESIINAYEGICV